jgi:hypothetical protein
MLQTNPIDEYLRQVAIVEAAGVTLPAEWLELRSQFDSFAQLSTPNLAQLTEEVLTGGPNVKSLRALAIAEQSIPEHIARVTNHVRRKVFDQLRTIYSGVARANYATIGKQFDMIANKFNSAATTVDPETPAAAMVSAADKPRKAWQDAESYAHRLTELLTPLAASAALAGVKDTDSEIILLPLTIDTAGQHRRKVWTSWLHTGGRTQRWGALVATGCTIRACPLDELQLYAELRPIEHRQRQIVGQPRGTYEIQVHDPEDDDYEPEPGPEMTMITRRAL